MRIILFLAILLGLGQVADAAFERVRVAAQPTAANGEYDPSIQYDSSGTGYMAYSLVSAPFVFTVLAKSADHGASWSYVQAVNVSQAGTICPGGTTITGVWRHEVPTLVHDPADTGKEWKLYWHHYFTKEPYADADRMFDYGWIGYKYTSDPEGAWSGEAALFGCSPFPTAPYSVAIDLRTLHPALNKFLVFTEPGGLQSGSRIYLAMQGSTTDLNDQALFLVSSPDHGATWSFDSYLAATTEARALGYSRFTAPALAQEAGRTFLLAAPQDASNYPCGTCAFEFLDLAAGTLCRDGDNRLALTLFLAPALDTVNAGEAAYHADNTAGGILFPQTQLTPSLEFQIWNTHLALLTPTPVPTVRTTVTPQASAPAVSGTGVRAFPNPASETLFIRTAGASGAVRVRLFNSAGECACDRLENAAEGSQVLRISVSGWAPGVYYYVVSFGSEKADSGKIAVVH